MKILFFSQFFTPESIAPSFRATDNAKLWKAMGHEVTVFTGYPNYPKGRIFDGYKPKLLTEKQIDGVRVLRSKLVAIPNTSIYKRLENAGSYFFFGWINTHFQSTKVGKNYDVVLGTSGLIFNALLAQLYAEKIKRPFVFEIRDITYLQMQATGCSGNSITVRAMKSLELRLCRKAAKVVVVTNGFKNKLMAEGVPEWKIHVVTNGVDVNVAEGAYDAGKRLVLSYFGTLGLSQNIKETFSYAEALSKQLPEFEYLLIGDGAQKAILKETAKSIPFVRMLDGMPSEKLEQFYSKTQISIVTLQKSDKFKDTIPSKLFQIMGRGIAVLFIGPDGESAQIIREYNAGLALTGTKDEDIKQLKTFFSVDDWQEKLKQMGVNGRKVVEEHYLRSELAKDYIKILEDAGKQGNE